MKIPLSWLKEYIDISLSPAQIAETLTLAGLEVEALESVGGAFQGVVTAQVLETAPHPNADRLKIAKVLHQGQELQIVCGAPNCRSGLTVALAPIGAKLKDKEQGDWTIKQSKIRGVESFGMLCSAQELGLGNLSHEGILELPTHLPLGIDLATLYQDTIFTLSFTPNLGHCMSIYGVAKELSALLNIPLKEPDHSPLDQEKSNTSLRDFIKVHVEDPSLCPHYSCRLVQSVEVGPSPDFLKTRLELCGHRSVNNVVDISNYLLLEFGHPLHFFDYDLLTGSTLFLESCQENTPLTTLDETFRTLPKGALVIKDAEKIVALAGVMGCANSAVTKNTKNVLIEAAVFSPSSIRKTCRFLGLHTDASHRFERAVDPLILPFILERATKMLVEVAHATPVKGRVDQSQPFSSLTLSCRPRRVNALLGTNLSTREMIDLLKRLGMRLVKEEPDHFDVIIPSFRNDIKQEIDLVEEIARLYGFSHIKGNASLYKASSLLSAPLFLCEQAIRSLLLQEGLQELLTCDLISPAAAGWMQEERNCIHVLHAKSSDYSVLRTSLLPGLLEVVRHNLDHSNPHLSGFEVGRIHLQKQGHFVEQTSIGIILCGLSSPHHPTSNPKEVDFFDLKGIIENLLEGYLIHEASFEPSSLSYFHPGRQASILTSERRLGTAGQVHPGLLQKLGIEKRVYFAELNLHELLDLHPKHLKVADLPLYPSSERDWTLPLRKETPVQKVLDFLQEEKSPLLEKAFLLDLFEGDPLGKDQKNATYRLIYRDQTKTLDFDTVEKEHASLTEKTLQKLCDYI